MYRKCLQVCFRVRNVPLAHLLKGPLPLGCHIHFVDTTGNTTAEKKNLPKPDGALSTIGCIDVLPPGVYRVMAYDIVSGGGTDDRVAAVGESLITVTASTIGMLHTIL